MLPGEYGVAQTVFFRMIVAGGTDFATSSDWTPATGDTKISKDGGAVANTTNNPSHVGSGIWSLTLTATEKQASNVSISVIDSATKAVEDNGLEIWTYGNASAHIETFPAGALDAAGTRSAVGLASANLDTQLAAIVEDTGTTLPALFPANFAAFGINASGHVSRVTLVDTTSENSDMRGTDGANTTAPDNAGIAAIKVTTDKLDDTLADNAGVFQFTVDALENAPSGGAGSSDWTATELEQIRYRLGIDGTESAPVTNTDQNLSVALTSASTELVANAVRTELAPELATISNIGDAESYNNEAADLRYITRGDAYDGTANPALTWTVTKDYTSGWTGTMTITHRVTGATLMSVSVTAASATQLTASLTTTNTAFALLVSDEEFGPHPYDVQMVNGSSEITAVPNGIAIIRKDRSTS